MKFSPYVATEKKTSVKEEQLYCNTFLSPNVDKAWFTLLKILFLITLGQDPAAGGRAWFTLLKILFFITKNYYRTRPCSRWQSLIYTVKNLIFHY